MVTHAKESNGRFYALVVAGTFIILSIIDAIVQIAT